MSQADVAGSGFSFGNRDLPQPIIEVALVTARQPGDTDCEPGIFDATLCWPYAISQAGSHSIRACLGCSCRLGALRGYLGLPYARHRSR